MLALSVFLIFAQGWADGTSRPEDLRISLVTFSPGTSLTEWWGHTALVVEDTKRQESRLYNFGMFGPKEGDTTAFAKDFAKGRLIFWVADDSVVATYRFYKEYLNRDVRIQELNLRPTEASQIAQSLARLVEPENRYYRYHHYQDNCSTRPRDIIDAAIDGQLKAATVGPGRTTLRGHALRYSQVSPVVAWFLDYLQGDYIDQPLSQQQEAYLPDELEMQVQSLQVNRPDGTREPLVRKQSNWFKSDRNAVPHLPPNWLWWHVLVGWLFGFGTWLVLRREPRSKLMQIGQGWFTVLVGFFFAFIGTVMVLMMNFTDHDVTFHNENLFQTSPLHWILVVAGVGLMLGKKWAPVWNRRVWLLSALVAFLGLVLKVFPNFDQANLGAIAVLLPIHAAGYFAWWRRGDHHQATGKAT